MTPEERDAAINAALDRSATVLELTEEIFRVNRLDSDDVLYFLERWPR